MMNKHTRPHLSRRAPAQEALQQHMGLRTSEMRPGQAKRMEVALAGLKALQESTGKQFEAKAAAAHRERMVTLATVLGGTPRASNKGKGRKP